MSENIRGELTALANKARGAASFLAAINTDRKNEALRAVAARLVSETDYILKANSLDLASADENGVRSSMLDRLTLSRERIQAIANSILKVEALPDPTGLSEGWTRPNGLYIERRRVPLGVIGIIYEARPNVTADAASLCLKSGNAVILRGGKDALNSNTAICKVINSALCDCGFPEGVVALIENPSREYTSELLRLRGYVDLVIPRGGKGLIQAVKENAAVPVIETGAGNCHIYVHSDADTDMAVNILVNAKTQRPSVCNAAESLLVHRDIAAEFLPLAKAALDRFSVELRGCPETQAILGSCVVPATEEDYAAEYNDFIMSVKVVGSLEEAVEHINRYSTGHSEAIITRSLDASRRFGTSVDSACVYTNASTRFTDGEEFGFGAEIGISTQKLHARGPLGLNELTCEKYFISGSGQVRK